ncbi:hypothetical protein AB0D11_02710 [Streptomyces monashensis]
MPQPVPARDAAVAGPAATVPRTGEPVPRPQYRDLFKEPDLPPDDESE